MTTHAPSEPEVSEETSSEPMPRSVDQLNVRMRKDLICRPRVMDGKRHFVIKDPIAMTFHYYREEDFFLLTCLDGKRSIGEIRSAYEYRFGNQVTDSHFQHLLMAVMRDRLVITNLPASTTPGRPTRPSGSRPRWLALLRNPLAIRFPPVDVSRTLDILQPRTRWIVHPLTLIIILVLAGAAALLISFNLATFQRRLPVAHEFFAARNLIWLMLALAATKVLHELAHALTCRHFGAECRNVGVMLLVFTPCLYCDVSDAWMIDSKWRRLLVASAGILVELFLASVCTWLWWTSEPGMLNSLCLNVMFICSIGTVLFNGNPLLRYDGYYMLSDLVDIPNLWRQSRQQLQAMSDRWLFGLPMRHRDDRRGRQLFLSVYGISSSLYRFVIVAAILYLVVSLMKSFQLFQFSLLPVAVTLTSVLALPFITSLKRRMNLARENRISGVRLTIVYVATGLGLIAAWNIPFPCWVNVPAYVELADAERVYVSTSGILIESLPAGTAVAPGQTLGRLVNPELRLEGQRIQQQYDQSRSRLQSLDVLRTFDSTMGNRIPAERQTGEELRSRLEQVNQRLQQLTLTCTQPGIVVSPRDRAEATTDAELGSWQGSPLDPENHLAQLETGTLFCLVSDPDSLEGFALIPQSVIDLVEPGQTVMLQVSDSPDRIHAGKIAQLAPLKNFELPMDLNEFILARYGRELRLNEVEFGTMYLATIRLDNRTSGLLNLESATASIRVSPRSIGARLTRYLKRTFVFLSD